MSIINKKNNESTISVKNIIYDSIMQNKIMIGSLIPLLSAYWLQDVVFPDKITGFTSDVPNFIKTLTFSSIFAIVYPYLISELLHFMNNIMVSDSLPKIELLVAKTITENVMESIKRTNAPINVNEFVMNLKKVIDTKSIYHLVASYIIPTFMVAIGLLYYFFHANTKIGMVAMIIILLFVCVTMYLEKDGIQDSCKNENEINSFYDNIEDVMHNLDTVITSSSKQKEIDNLENNKKKVSFTYIKSEVESSKTTFTLHLISLITALILNGISIKMYIDKEITEKSLASVCIMTILFMRYYDSTIATLKDTISQFGKFYEIEKYFSQFKISEFANNKILNVTNGNIEFNNLNVTKSGKNIIKNFNNTIKGNSVTGFVGKVGSGKTMLLKIIAGLENYSGNIYIDGQNISECDHDSIAKNIAYIPQHPRMFNNTIYHNLNYGSNKTKAQVLDFINAIGFDVFFKKFPKRLDFKVGKEGKNLSGGQKQVIALIRELLKDKKIILLDEPTSALDTETKELIIKILSNIKNKTVIIVTHDKSIDNLFDNVIEIK